MRFIDQEQELGRDIPKVFGNADYKEYRTQLEQIDVLLIRSGMETRFVERCLEDWARTGQRIGTRARLRYQKMCIVTDSYRTDTSRRFSLAGRIRQGFRHGALNSAAISAGGRRGAGQSA